MFFLQQESFTLVVGYFIKCFYIATGKRGYPHNIFLISRRKHVVGTLKKRLGEALLMSTHNICREIRKISAFFR